MSYDEKFRGVDSVEHGGNTQHGLKCGHCNREVSALEIARYQGSKGEITYWLVCGVCSHGSVIDRNGKTYPSASYGDNVEGLPEVVKSAFDEARDVFSVGAFTSCQLICRKLLMHIAVDKCDFHEGKNFSDYVKALEDSKLISPLMKPWVDKIRKEGNDATHKLEPPSKGDAENILNFITQLLKVIYEMEHKMKQFGQTESKE